MEISEELLTMQLRPNQVNNICRDLMRSGSVISAIIMIRAAYGFGIKEAKDHVERTWGDQLPPDFLTRTGHFPEAAGSVRVRVAVAFDTHGAPEAATIRDDGAENAWVHLAGLGYPFQGAIITADVSPPRPAEIAGAVEEVR